MSEWKETEIGRIPKHWEICNVDEIKLPEIKSIISGPFGSNISAKFFVECGIPVIRGNNLSLTFTEKFKDSGFVFITEEKANELNTWAKLNDIVFTAVGTIGQVGIILENQKFERYIISNKQLRLTVDEKKVLPLYAYYWFASPIMIDIIKQRNTGSSVPLINLSVLKSLSIPVPPIPEQKAMTEVLNSLNDKIDLLHRQNKTLEQMAETLFRQRFVEEAEEYWEERSLGDYISVKHGYAFKGANISNTPTNLKLVTPGNFKIGGGFKSDKFKYYTSTQFPETYIFKSGDLIVTMTDLSVNGDTLGSPALIPNHKPDEQYLHNQRVGKIEFQVEIGKLFIYYLMKTREYQWYVHSIASGTSIRHTSPTSICSYSFRVPTKRLLIDFEEHVKSLVDKIDYNNSQIRCLEELRDTLLPKLMSGEVKVSIDE